MRRERHVVQRIEDELKQNQKKRERRLRSACVHQKKATRAPCNLATMERAPRNGRVPEAIRWSGAQATYQ